MVILRDNYRVPVVFYVSRIYLLVQEELKDDMSLGDVCGRGVEPVGVLLTF